LWQVGLRGINDGVLLKCHITRLIKKYFRGKPYYIDMCDLWNEVGVLPSKIVSLKYKLTSFVIVTFECLVQIALQTSLGQMLDLISTHNGPVNLAKYNIEGYVTHPST
jgi:farnesyl diphosphate synthase